MFGNSEHESSFYIIWSPPFGETCSFLGVYISDQIHSSLLRAPQRWARLRCIGTRSVSSTETSIGNRKKIIKCLLYMSIYCLHCNPYSQHHYELLLHYCTLSYHICIIEYTCKTLHSLYFYIQVNNNVIITSIRWFTFVFLFPWHVPQFSRGPKLLQGQMGGINWSHLCQEEVLCTLHDFNRTHGDRSENVQKTKGLYIQKYTHVHGTSTFLKATDHLIEGHLLSMWSCS